jgi:hypothetical protein
MLILGLLLVVLSAAAAALLVAYNSSGGPEQMIALFGRDLASVNPLEAFVAGIVLTLIFGLGVWMVTAAGRRARAVRSEYRSVRRETRAVAAERDELAEQLAREREAAAAQERDIAAGQPAPGPAPARDEVVAPQAGDRSDERPGEHRGVGRHFRMPHRRSDTPAEQPPAPMTRPPQQ